MFLDLYYEAHVAVTQLNALRTCQSYTNVDLRRSVWEWMTNHKLWKRWHWKNCRKRNAFDRLLNRWWQAHRYPRRLRRTITIDNVSYDTIRCVKRV